MARKKITTNSNVVKKDFIMEYAEQNRLTYIEAKERVENILDLMKDNFRRKNNLIFRGFGSFHFKETLRKSARNPQTGEEVECIPKKNVKLKVSSKVFK